MEYLSDVVKPLRNVKRAFSLIGENLVAYVLMTLICGIAMIVISMLIGAASYFVLSLLMGSPNGLSQVGSKSGIVVFQIANMLLSGFLEIFVQAVQASMTAGFFMSFKQQREGLVVDVSGVFSGFEYFSRFLITSAFFVAIKLVFSLVLLGLGVGVGSKFGTEIFTNIAMNPAASGLTGALVFVLGLVWILITLVAFALTAFVWPLIALRDMSPWNAIVVSFKAGLANILPLCLLGILSFLLAVGGLLACIVGLLYAIPVILASTYFSFTDVFGESDSNSDINPPAPEYYGIEPNFSGE